MMHLQVGILDEERILPPGKEITAVGILDSDIDGQPIIKSSKQMPFFLYVTKHNCEMNVMWAHWKLSVCICV
jgi:hypothetical protein